MGVIGIHHVQICIPKGMENEARAFYCQVIGLPEIEKPASLQGRGGFWIQVGDREVHVGTEEGVDRFATKAHIAYEVEEIDVMRTLMEENHIEIFESVPIPGFSRFEIRDPFGNRVEFIQRL